MNRRYRKTIIAGNWKMNKTPAEAKAFINELRALASKARWCDIVLCVPFVDIPAAEKAAKGSRIAIGAQNVHFESSGAYTGEVAASMLTVLDVKYVIIGHSERRQYFAETDDTVRLKVNAALAAGLRPIVCVGETLAERELGVTTDVVRRQIKAAVANLSCVEMKKVVVAYEPIWAIGTGKTATADEADHMGAVIRETLREKFGARAARAVSILYGGSMNANNAAELLSKPDVDGGLIGGASLKTEDFSKIIAAANNDAEDAE